MLTVDEAWRVVDERVAALPSARQPLAQVRGLRLAEDICAPEDMPAFNRSAIDGFMVAADAAPGKFQLAGEVRPGQATAAVPGRGEVIRISTGAALPESGVGLVMVEDAELEGSAVTIRQAPSAALIRPRASQARQGQVLLEAGARLSAGAIALLASVGAAEPLASPRLRVAHVSTGSELVDVGEQPGAGSIRDSNSPLLAAMIEEAGGTRVFHGRASEDIGEVVDTLRDVQADVYLLSGGASMGEHDGNAEALERLGFTIHLSKVKSRPGKPLVFASRGTQAAFVLPGNPLSHFVCFHLFVRRALDRLAGFAPRALSPVEIEGGPPKPDPRETWWPAVVSPRLTARPLPWRDSSDLIGLARANALLRIGSGGTNGLVEALIFDTLQA